MMKKLLIAAVAGATFVGPLTLSSANAEPYGYDRRDHDRYDRYDRRDHDRYGRYDRYERRHYRHNRWRRGERLGVYSRYYAPVDYRAYRLRAPPRGYHYVRDDRGDIILAAIATGVILSVIANSN